MEMPYFPATESAVGMSWYQIVLRKRSARIRFLTVTVTEPWIDTNRNFDGILRFRTRVQRFSELMNHVDRTAVYVNPVFYAEFQRFAVENVGGVHDFGDFLFRFGAGFVPDCERTTDFHRTHRIDFRAGIAQEFSGYERLLHAFLCVTNHVERFRRFLNLGQILFSSYTKVGVPNSLTISAICTPALSFIIAGIWMGVGIIKSFQKHRFPSVFQIYTNRTLRFTVGEKIGIGRFF